MLRKCTCAGVPSGRTAMYFCWAETSRNLGIFPGCDESDHQHALSRHSAGTQHALSPRSARAQHALSRHHATSPRSARAQHRSGGTSHSMQSACNQHRSGGTSHLGFEHETLQLAQREPVRHPHKVASRGHLALHGHRDRLLQPLVETVTHVHAGFVTRLEARDVERRENLLHLMRGAISMPSACHHHAAPLEPPSCTLSAVAPGVAESASTRKPPLFVRSSCTHLPSSGCTQGGIWGHSACAQRPPSACAIRMKSACNRHAIGMQSVCNQYAISMHSEAAISMRT